MTQDPALQLTLFKLSELKSIIATNKQEIFENNKKVLESIKILESELQEVKDGFTKHFNATRDMFDDNQTETTVKFLEITEMFQMISNKIEKLQPTTNKPKYSFLSVYNALSNSGQEIRILADQGASHSLVHQRAINKLGDTTPNGKTSITTVGNIPLKSNVQITRFNLNTFFGNEWENKEVDAAILSKVVTQKQENLTVPIVKALQCLQLYKPQLMRQYGQLFKVENFQTFRAEGEISLLLGMETMSMHPKPLIVFQHDLIISLIRQPVRDNKFLILSGTMENIDNLDAKIEVYVTPDIVKHFIQEPQEEDHYTESEKGREQEQNPKKPKEHLTSQQSQHHGLLRAQTLFPIPPRVPFHHLWKQFQ